jgi:integrase
VRLPDNREIRRKRERIIDRELAEAHRIATDYRDPLTKSDAQRVLDLLIAQDAGKYTAPNTSSTLAGVARKYLELNLPLWGPHMRLSAGSIVEKHIIAGDLGERPIIEVTEAEIQAWINRYMTAGASRSLLKALLLHIRGVFKCARKQKLMSENPTEDLRARSRKQPSERFLSVDECRRLLGELSGRDHLIVRMLIQTGLRPEELFALRREDVQGDLLRVDEAIVFGEIAPTKTKASDAFVYLPAEINIELTAWMEANPGDSTDWLFQTAHGRKGFLNANNFRNRVLKPAAIKAGLGVSDTGKVDAEGEPILRTDVDLRCLRRTCGTWFGDVAKDPKSVQTQLRHADPTISLRHYQKSIPQTVRAAADEMERNFAFGLPTPPETIN